MPRVAPTLEGPIPNYVRLRREAQQAVSNELGIIARPDVRIGLAADIIRQADAEIGLHSDERNAALASLWFYDHIQAVSLGHAIGVNRNAVREILSSVAYGDAKKPLPPRMTDEELTELGEQLGVQRVESAAERLPSLGRIIEKAKARRGRAVRFMQDAALALTEEPYGWDPARIADHAGVQRRLIYKHLAAAKQRQAR
ncbi:hypothetical protein [Streptomyces sp. NBC_00620]|uniref:hypothetical protein n=1 Tax=Streptomyces sp. NBC_00620 TaxID=2903666 RepID=UPI00224E2287|nr:hypothetical protein [Streptomyces sp. NBC_00620]MCX4976484.1 hypothetical protein [Streptomyces sp. NBC_00620]